MSTADVALARMAFSLARQPTMEELVTQLGIDETMRAVVADPRKDPTAQPPQPTVTVGGAPKATDPFEPNRSGWVEPTPLQSPVPKGSFIEGLMGRMIDNALGPVNGPERKVESSSSSTVVAAPVDELTSGSADRDGGGDASAEPSPSSEGSVAASDLREPMAGGRGQDAAATSYDVVGGVLPAPKRRKLG